MPLNAPIAPAPAAAGGLAGVPIEAALGGAPIASPGPLAVPDAVAPKAQAPQVPEIVQKNPLAQAVFVGAVPAVSAPSKASNKVLDSLDMQEVLDAGLDFYLSRDESLMALFNPSLISQEDLIAADSAGQLEAAAPPFEKVLTALGKADLLDKAAPEPQTAKPAKGVSATPPQSPLPGPSTMSQTLATERKRNLEPGAPTSGPKPGAGRLMNKILQKAV